MSTFAIPNEKNGSPNAEIAQLVEHNLAKVGVASSSLVFRSNKILNRIGAVVQLDRILACHARGRGFESRPHRQNKKERDPAEVLFFMKGTA